MELVCLNVWNEKKEKNITQKLLTIKLKTKSEDVKKATIIVKLVPEANTTPDENIKKRYVKTPRFLGASKY
jgi:hypothetical protein